jgi:Regulator of chromosome condensation (RCC1) repeat
MQVRLDGLVRWHGERSRSTDTGEVYHYCGKSTRISRQTATAPRPPRGEGKGRPALPPPVSLASWRLGGSLPSPTFRSSAESKTSQSQLRRRVGNLRAMQPLCTNLAPIAPRAVDTKYWSKHVNRHFYKMTILSLALAEALLLSRCRRSRTLVEPDTQETSRHPPQATSSTPTPTPAAASTAHTVVPHGPEKLRLHGHGTCGIWPDGVARCWGDVTSGGIIRPTMQANELPITPVQEIVDSDCVILLDGSLRNVRPSSVGSICDLDPLKQIGPIEDADVGADILCARRRLGDSVCWKLEWGKGPAAKDRLSRIQELNDVIDFAKGAEHACTLRSDRSVWCWGDNASGQLGDGTLQKRTVPVQVFGLRGAVQIDAGDAHTCALLSTGVIRCWGSNQQGQLGIGQFPYAGHDEREEANNPPWRSRPETVRGLGNVAEIALGSEHTCARPSDGKVLCWGSNSVGQSGGSTSERLSSPTPISGLGRVRHVAARGTETCAHMESSDVLCWGYSPFGDLGAPPYKATRAPRLLRW